MSEYEVTGRGTRHDERQFSPPTTGGQRARSFFLIEEFPDIHILGEKKAIGKVAMEQLHGNLADRLFFS